jgi:hypothetical protein
MAHARFSQESDAYIFSSGTEENPNLDTCTSYHLFDTGFATEGKEMWSEMRKSELEPFAYLDRYFFTGAENGDRGPKSSAATANNFEHSGRRTRPRSLDFQALAQR